MSDKSNIISLDGDWETKEVYITKNGKTRRLSPLTAQALRNHSPDGFNWGYGGSGPAQLALSVLLYYHNDPHIALRNYQDFKFKVIAALPQSDFAVKIDMADYKIVTDEVDKIA